MGQLESLRGEVEALQKELINMESQLCEKDKSHWTKESRVKELEVCNAETHPQALMSSPLFLGNVESGEGKVF